MKYKELMNRISEMTPEQQDMDVSVYLLQEDESFPMVDLELVTDVHPLDGVLDENHPVLTIDT